jgi:hypothetical protein
MTFPSISTITAPPKPRSAAALVSCASIAAAIGPLETSTRFTD